MNQESLRDELLTTAQCRLKKLRELIRLSEEQQSILRDGLHEELHENLRKHDSILHDLDRLSRREEAIVKLLDQKDAEHSDDKLNAMRQQAGELALRLRGIIAANTELLKNSMEYTRFSLDLISKLISEQRATTEGNWSGALLLDKKV